MNASIIHHKITDTIFLFDVDGTLTPSRQKITLTVLNHLKHLRQHVLIGFVGGSNLEKQKEQVNDDILSLFDYSFPENGVSFYRGTDLISQTKIIECLGEDMLQDVINDSMLFLGKIKLPFKRGCFFELRDSMLNVSPCGRSSNINERKSFFEYDKEHNIRKKYVDFMKVKYPKVKFSIGGQISIDVFPQGWDKTFCLNHLENDKIQNIYFFGDMVQPDQNDHEIYHHDNVHGIFVTGPDDTIQKSSELLEKVMKDHQ